MPLALRQGVPSVVRAPQEPRAGGALVREAKALAGRADYTVASPKPNIDLGFRICDPHILRASGAEISP